jgi:hypothetical protein
MAERCPGCGGQDVRRTFLVSGGTWVASEPEDPCIERVACRSLLCGAEFLVNHPGRLRREAIVALAERWESRRYQGAAEPPPRVPVRARPGRAPAAEPGRFPLLVLVPVTRRPDRRATVRVARPWRTP